MEFEKIKKGSNFKLHIISGKFELNNPPATVPTRRCFIRQRHVVSLFAFLTCFLSCVNRLVLGVGIVAMVKHRHTNATLSMNETEVSCPTLSSNSISPAVPNFQGEFDWSPELQGYILGSGFLALLVTQIPAGRFADAVGSKFLLVTANAVSGILTGLSPFAARWHVYALIAVQLLRGGCQGFTIPAVYKLISNWIPRNERGTLSTLVVSGFATGIAAGGIATGWLSDIPGLGWPSAFYISGAFGFALCMAGILVARCNAFINILCFTLSLYASGIALSGIVISGVDMAPNFAGSIMGVASTFASVSCIIIPVITGYVTTNETLSEWQTIFWINLIVVGTSGLVYIVFGSAEVQPWNYPDAKQSSEDKTEERRHEDKNLNQTQETKEKF